MRLVAAALLVALAPNALFAEPLPSLERRRHQDRDPRLRRQRHRRDLQERYDTFMNNFTEHTRYLPVVNDAVTELMQTYVQYPPRPLQSEGYSGPITLTQYQRFQNVRDQLQQQGFSLGLSGQ
jgi:hypothetical protein